ncbi:MAG: hypothetical protein RR942_15965 [Romboutsia sp.]
MKKQLTLKSYMLEKCLIGYGIINGIINALIFYAMEKGHPDMMFETFDILADIGATTFILGIILMYCVVPLTKMDMNKKFTVPQNVNNKIASMLPDKKILMALSIGLITMVITVAICAVISMILPLPLNVKQMGIFKGLACSVAGGIAGYLTISKTVFSTGNITKKSA